jgi:hypothetical protein
MPIYQFAVRHGGEQDDDVRWMHLPDEKAARHFANQLIRDILSGGRQPDRVRYYLDIKNEDGELLLAIPCAPTREESV